MRFEVTSTHIIHIYNTYTRARRTVLIRCGRRGGAMRCTVLIRRPANSCGNATAPTDEENEEKRVGGRGCGVKRIPVCSDRAIRFCFTTIHRESRKLRPARNDETYALDRIPFTTAIMQPCLRLTVDLPFFLSIAFSSFSFSPEHLLYTFPAADLQRNPPRSNDNVCPGNSRGDSRPLSLSLS